MSSSSRRQLFGSRPARWHGTFGWRWVLSALFLGITVVPATAHDFTIIETRLEVGPEVDRGAEFVAELIVDLDALLLGVGAGHDPTELIATIDGLSPEERADREARLRQMFERRARVLADGEPVPFTVEFAQAEDSTWADNFELDQPSRLGVVARLEGQLPAETDTVGMRLSRAFGTSRLVVDHGGSRSPAQLVPPGTDSVPVDLDDLEASGRWTAVSWRYLVLGFTHILPLGLDHLLFVLGLCLVPRGKAGENRLMTSGKDQSAGAGVAWGSAVRTLVLLVTVFTVAHATTLALSMLREWSVPGEIIEPLIAASILAVAGEALWPGRTHDALRAGVVFAFGLLHGLGFASVLFELGLPAGRRGLALVTFHLGVEAAQILVVSIAVLLLWPWAGRSWYLPRVARPLAAAIGLVATIWLVQRTLL